MNLVDSLIDAVDSFSFVCGASTLAECVMYCTVDGDTIARSGWPVAPSLVHLTTVIVAIAWL
jgi:hypothetical protein